MPIYWIIITYLILFQGTPCDLLTGEERKYINGPDNPANHLSCSVEMVNLQSNCRYHFVSCNIESIYAAKLILINHVLL